MLLQDYFDFTLNTTFLEHHAYPLTKLVGEFYLSYMTRENGQYNVLHGCAMEGCNAQGHLHNANITFSNNPNVDLAFVKRTFRDLVRYSKILGVDAEMRAAWQDVLDKIAPYPLSKDQWGRSVFAQATLNSGTSSTDTDGFPIGANCSIHDPHNSSGCFNARYPIVYFTAMHPGEDVDLASDRALLEVGRRTAAVVNEINLYYPTNSIAMAWPPSSRVVNSSTWLLSKFSGAIRKILLPNVSAETDGLGR